MVQIVGTLAVVLLLPIVFSIFYHMRRKERPDLEVYSRKTIDGVIKTIKDEIAERTKEDEVILATDVNYEAIIRSKRRLRSSLDKAVHGITDDRKIVISLISDILTREFPNRDTTMDIMDFDNPVALDSEMKFILIVQRLRNKNITDAIGWIDKEYHISDIKQSLLDPSVDRIREFDYITLDKVFTDLMTLEDGETDVIEYEEIINAFSIFFFSKVLGFGALDVLMHLKCDGIEFGTSGSIRYAIDGNFDIPYKTTNSVWVQINARWALFSFIDFYTVNEMQRVANQLVSWGKSAPMTEKSPSKVTDGWDGSRRVTIRPPAAESWCIFIRNFTLSIYKMEQLLDKPYLTNWELPQQLMYFLMKGQRTAAFTGQQNTGKTTIMKSAIEYVELINIRVLEMSFELSLRETYPNKNIETVKPTAHITAGELQDLLKKTDGYLSMVGEVAEDTVAARMLQFCLIGSAFTMFSHHAKDDFGLITGLRNSLVSSGEYNDIAVAESLVLDAIKHNVHMDFNNNNQRIIGYISYISKENELSAYPTLEEYLGSAKRALSGDGGEVSEDAKATVALAMLQREYYTRTTDRVKFKSRKIMEYDEKTSAYVPREFYPPEVVRDMLVKMDYADQQAFMAFYRKYWG